MPRGRAVRVSRGWGTKPMGGTRPASGSDLVHRCCLVLCTAAMTSFGAAALCAPATPAATQAAPPRQSAHADNAKPRRFVRSHHRIRSVGAGQEDRSREDRSLASLSERLNNNTLAVLAGGLGSTDLAVAQDLAATLNDGDNLRVLPMVGAGGGRNV